MTSSKNTGTEVLPDHILDRAHSFLSPNTTWIPLDVSGVGRTGPFAEITPSVAVNSITGVAEYTTRGQDPRGRPFVLIARP